MTCALYRHYDGDGRLLYVGISLSPIKRLSQHRSKSNWSADIRRVDVEMHPDRASADAAEGVAIRAEKPRYNQAKTAIGGRPKYAAIGNAESAREIIAQIGAARLAAVLEVTPHAIQFARVKGIPSGWYPDVLAMCDEAGIPCPLDAFNWGAKRRAGGEERAPKSDAAA